MNTTADINGLVLQKQKFHLYGIHTLRNLLKKEVPMNKWLTLLISLLMVLGCTRRDIVDGLSTKALLPVNVYWTKANLKAQNTTVMVYDESGALYLEKSFSSSADHLSAYGEIALEPGDYTVIVFNEIRGRRSIRRLGRADRRGQGWGNAADSAGELRSEARRVGKEC